MRKMKFTVNEKWQIKKATDKIKSELDKDISDIDVIMNESSSINKLVKKKSE